MDTVKLYAFAAFAAGLIITLFLAAYLTPRGWWRRPNARALFIMIVGTWGFGSLILYATHGATPAHAGTASTMPAAPVVAAVGADSAVTAGSPFRVHRDLNLRAAPGVHAARVGVVPAGASVTPTGERDGDWWQIQATIHGRAQTGWASSLWLRRSSE
ncbi:SH3 domain-containing protein [Duganella sp.]|uniref:SH3 domain-containing protein n=1 Tax=Duganella sp. TaxID=1904440 RepID=UPI0031DC376B